MKKLNWNKLPDRELNQNPHALWVKLQSATLKYPVNFATLEEQFAQRQAEAKQESSEKEKSNKVCGLSLFVLI